MVRGMVKNVIKDFCIYWYTNCKKKYQDKQIVEKMALNSTQATHVTCLAPKTNDIRECNKYVVCFDEFLKERMDLLIRFFTERIKIVHTRYLTRASVEDVLGIFKKGLDEDKINKLLKMKNLSLVQYFEFDIFLYIYIIKNFLSLRCKI